VKLLSKHAHAQLAVPRELVEFPEIDAAQWVRGLTARERGEYETASYQIRRGEVQEHRENLNNAFARLALLGMCDEVGARMYTDKELAAVSALPAFFLDRCCDVIRRLSGMEKAQAKDQKKDSGPEASSEPPSS
jgi:hypothetical protein